MYFRNWLVEVENRGGTKMRVPDGKAKGMYSGRAGQNPFSPEKPATQAPNVQGDPTIPISKFTIGIPKSKVPSAAVPSTFNPPSNFIQGKVPGGKFGGPIGSFQPLQVTPFNGATAKIDPQPSNFVTSRKQASQQSHM